MLDVKGNSLSLRGDRCAHAQFGCNTRGACALKYFATRRAGLHLLTQQGIMASKSFTALPSVVSVYAEKTAVQMRCYSRGFEKVTWPIVAIVVDAVALVCLAVAAGTPMWVEVCIVLNKYVIAVY